MHDTRRELSTCLVFCLSMCAAADILDQRCWRELKTVAKDKGLEVLSEHAESLVMDTHATATVKAYEGAYGRWRTWANSHSFQALPADPAAVSLYLVHLLEQSSSASAVSKAKAAIRWAHEKACLPLPFNSMVEQIATAAKRRAAKPPARKRPFSREQVAAMVRELALDSDCFKLRTAVMIAVGFAGFMRWDDLQRIRVGNIAFHSKHMEIQLEKRKNDQMRQGTSVFISKQGQEIGAYALCQRLIQTAGLESEDLLLSNLVKKKERWTRKKGSLNYTRARELLQEAVGKAGMDPTEFGLHSLRSGGTTAAAAAKVPQRLLKRQGGWRSEAVNVYIQETLDNLLAPSEAASW